MFITAYFFQSCFTNLLEYHLHINKNLQVLVYSYASSLTPSYPCPPIQPFTIPPSSLQPSKTLYCLKILLLYIKYCILQTFQIGGIVAMAIFYPTRNPSLNLRPFGLLEWLQQWHTKILICYFRSGC